MIYSTSNSFATNHKQFYSYATCEECHKIIKSGDNNLLQTLYYKKQL